MNKAIYPLELSVKVTEAASRLAQQEGISLNDWLVLAITQKVGSEEEVATFLKRKAAGASGRGLQFHLDRAPDVPPMPGDELPEGWHKSN